MTGVFFVLFLTWTPHSRNSLSQSSLKSSFDARGSPWSLGLNHIHNFHFFFTIWVRCKRNRLSQSSSKSSFDARGSPSSLGLNHIRNFHFFFTIWVRCIKKLSIELAEGISRVFQRRLIQNYERCERFVSVNGELSQFSPSSPANFLPVHGTLYRQNKGTLGPEKSEF